MPATKTKARPTVEAMDIDALLAQEPTVAPAGGHETTAEPQGPVHPIRQIRIRRQLVPLEVIGTLWAGGAVAAARPDAAVPIIGLYLSVGILVWWVKGRREPDLWERQRRRRWTTIITVSGGVWLSWAAMSAADGAQGATLLTVGALLAVPYWIRHRIPVPGAARTAPAEPVVETVVVRETDPIPGRWAETIGAPNGLLPGSSLEIRGKKGDGTAYTIILVGGKQTYRSVKQLEPQIASAYGRSLAEVTVDPYPTANEDRAILLVASQSRNPLQATLIHPGYDQTFDPTTGYYTFGYHPDMGPARWGFWIPGWGMCSGTLFGGTGAGKSELQQQLGIAARRTGYLSVWQGCPVGGASFAGTIDHCDWPARSREGILEQLRGARVIMQVNKALINLQRKPDGRRLDLFTPTPEYPGVLLQLDEIHKVFQEDWPGRAEAHILAKSIVQEGRKFGVGLLLADQGMGLEVFNNDDVFRANAWGKNNVVLRLDSSSAVTMVPRLEGNPALLPAAWPDGSPTVGLGYSVGVRAAMMRTLLTADPVAEMTAVPAVGISRVAAKKIGAPWEHRFENGEEELAAQAEFLADGDPELVEELLAGDPALADALARYRAKPKPASPQAVVAGQQADAPEGEWWNLPTPALTVVREPEHPILRTAGVRRVHEIVCSGITRRGEIIAHADLSTTTVDEALKALKEAELLRNPRHGIWEKAA